jgi:uncharacterized membrane protein YjfL (UPF0719 family)
MNEGTSQGHGRPKHQRPKDPPDAIPGLAPELIHKAIQEASVQFLVKREEHGRDATTALIGQIAVVGSFLGAFSLLDDASKAAVLQSEFALWALIAAAVSLLFSLSTYFLLPAKMPSLNQPEALRKFWNDRVATRRLLLITALIALAVAIVFATQALSEARGEVAPTPAATISGKLSPAADTASSLEASAVWQGLEPGENVILCVVAPVDTVLGGTIGGAGGDGKQTLTLTVPVTSEATGEFTMTTARLESAPTADATPTSTCKADEPARVGTQTSTSLIVG